MERPLISVIIPVYNGEKMIEKLNLTPGHVSVFGLINNICSKVFPFKNADCMFDSFVFRFISKLKFNPNLLNVSFNASK